MEILLDKASIYNGLHRSNNSKHDGIGVYQANDTVFALGTVERNQNGTIILDAEIVCTDISAVGNGHYDVARAILFFFPAILPVPVLDVVIIFLLALAPIGYYRFVRRRIADNQTFIDSNNGIFPVKLPEKYSAPDSALRMHTYLWDRNVFAIVIGLIITTVGFIFFILNFLWIGEDDSRFGLMVVLIFVFITSGFLSVIGISGLLKLKRWTAFTDDGFESCTVFGKREGYYWKDLRWGFAHDGSHVLGDRFKSWSVSIDFNNNQETKLEGFTKEMAERIDKTAENREDVLEPAEYIRRRLAGMKDPDVRPELERALKILERHGSRMLARKKAVAGDDPGSG
jgi:hypothetical protein